MTGHSRPSEVSPRHDVQTYSFDRLAIPHGSAGATRREFDSRSKHAGGTRPPTYRKAALMPIEITDALARVAAANGMSVAAWEEHCLALEAIERSRRHVDRHMRQAPRYQDAA